LSLFVTFEGPEGSGKTTQIQRLHEALLAQGCRVVCTREPGGTAIGEQIRDVLHSLDNVAMLPNTEALLYTAARSQHVGQVIAPALARDEVVICDRYAESTLAYQGHGHGLDLDVLATLTRFATAGLRPDLIIYLDLDVGVGLQRKRRDQERGEGEWNRMDDKSIAFYRRVRDAYLGMAHDDPERWLVIDATLAIESVHRLILEKVEARLTA